MKQKPILVRMKNSCLIIICFFLFPYYGFSQTKDSVTLKGKLTIHVDPRVDSLIQSINNSNLSKQSLKGFRIQIYSGSSRIDANKVKADFLEAYPNQKIYLDYKEPYYKIRVGDFRNKIEAQPLYQELLQDPRFKAILIVPDEINFPDLRQENNNPHE